MEDYTPPAIHQPIPYPLVLDPQTGEPFTAAAVAGLHRKLREELLATVQAFLAEEAGLDPWAIEARWMSPSVHAALDSLTSSALSQEQEQHNQEKDLWEKENPEAAFQERVELLAAEAAHLNEVRRRDGSHP